MPLPVGRTVKVYTKVFRVLKSKDASCMLRKRQCQRDEVVRKYGAWRMLSCNAAVFVVFAILFFFLYNNSAQDARIQ